MGHKRQYGRIGWASVALLAILGGYGLARATEESFIVGACFGTNGETAQTTWVGGEVDRFYPSPMSAVVEQHEGGFSVTQMVFFFRGPPPGRVFMPLVNN